MPVRTAEVTRKTRETDISVKLNLDGSGKADIQTPIGFLDHMLETFTRHGMFDLEVRCTGDTQVDQHHTLEDLGMVIGQAFNEALEDCKGIRRAGSFVFPMDESLSAVAVDFGGRPYLIYDVEFKRQMCGELDTDVIEDFFGGFSTASKSNVAVRVLTGRSDHHKVEGVFKAFARALRDATEIDPRAEGEVVSTKGVID